MCLLTLGAEVPIQPASVIIPQEDMPLVPLSQPRGWLGCGCVGWHLILSFWVCVIFFVLFCFSSPSQEFEQKIPNSTTYYSHPTSPACSESGLVLFQKSPLADTLQGTIKQFAKAMLWALRSWRRWSSIDLTGVRLPTVAFPKVRSKED